MSFIYLALIGTVLLFLIAYVVSNRDILAPSVVMTIMFILSYSFAIPNLGKWNIDYSGEASLITLSGIFVFIIAEVFLSALFFRKKVNSYPEQYASDNLNNSKLVLLVILNLIIVLWYFFKIRSIVGGDISDTFLNYRRLGIDNLNGKNVETVGGIIQQFLKIVEGSGYVSGYILMKRTVWEQKGKFTTFLLISLIIISVLPSSFGAGRTQILKLLSAILIFYYILWHQKNGWDRNLSWKMIRVGLSGLIVGIPGFYYSLALLGRSTNRTLFDYVADYISSGILLFSDYLKSPVPRVMAGEESLFNLFKFLNFLGLTEKSQSYNLEFRKLGVGYSNVYSFFRRPLHDFGLIGMYMFVALIAIFFAYMYFGKIKNKPLSPSTTRWTLIYGYFYYWIVSSSIIQYSTAYVAVGTVLNLVVILLLYNFLSGNQRRIKFKWS